MYTELNRPTFSLKVSSAHLDTSFFFNGASLAAQLVKKPPTMQETWVRSLGWEDLLEKGKATHSSILGLENSMGCIVHGVAKSQTRLSDFHFSMEHLSELD